MCSDVDALRASFDELRNVEVSQAGLSKLKGDLAQVKSDVSDVVDSATDEYADEVDAVEQAASTLGTHLSAATDAPSASTFAPLRADLQALGKLPDGAAGRRRGHLLSRSGPPCPQTLERSPAPGCRAW